MHSLIFHINHPFFNIFEQQNFHNLKQRILDTARERSILVRASYRISSSLRFPWTKERRERENPVSPSRHLSSREDLRHVSNSKQFCDSIRDREKRRGWLADVIADKTASIFCRKVEIVPGTHGGIPAKTDNDRQRAANRAGWDNLGRVSRQRYPPGKGDRSARPHASLAVKNSDKDYNSATRHFVSDLSLHHLERIKRRGMNFLNKISEKILSRREN